MSGIYIKGMEMPTGNDAITLFIYPDRKVVVCGRLGPLERYKAVPVPDHGRLGDLDVLAEKLKRLREFHADDSRSAPFIVAGISQCIDILTGREAPTIVPAEEDE